ncbi:MAG TPA: ANTAR domain-containing protein [Burkholderiales bacterium]|nr:ANTAR domain-containing protein [Burkholderiales bacterium]
MPTLLLLHEGAADAAALRAALSSTSYRVAGELSDAARLGAEVGRVAPDVIIACTQTPSAAVLDALRSLAAAAPRPVVMFATDPRREVIRRTVEAGVAAYVVDGWSHARVGAIIEAAIARFDAYESLKRELRTTQDKLAERKIVEKAKGLVMQQRGVSEDQAYSSLRKMAMDQNLTLAEVARRVVAVAHLLA